MKTIVIKIGGVASKQLNKDVINQLKNWKQQGHNLVIVHGGGFAISDLMEDRKSDVKKVNGLRVTDKEDMLLVRYGLLHQVGKSLSYRLNQEGLDAIQLNTSLKSIVKADYLNQSIYGYVGQVKSVNPILIEKVLEDGMIPVLASLGYTTSGTELNINADYLATAVAQSLQADQLILMTDVDGVLENGQVLDAIEITQVPQKIQKGIITGGMIPKLESAVKTIQKGVSQVMIGKTLTSGTIIKEG